MVISVYPLELEVIYGSRVTHSFHFSIDAKVFPIGLWTYMDSSIGTSFAED